VRNLRWKLLAVGRTVTCYCVGVREKPLFVNSFSVLRACSRTDRLKLVAGDLDGNDQIPYNIHSLEASSNRFTCLRVQGRRQGFP
jgi:hypothetical protein